MQKYWTCYAQIIRRLKELCHEDITLQILSGGTNHNNLFGWPNFFKFQIHAHPCGPLQQTTGKNFID